ATMKVGKIGRRRQETPDPVPDEPPEEADGDQHGDQQGTADDQAVDTQSRVPARTPRLRLWRRWRSSGLRSKVSCPRTTQTGRSHGNIWSSASRCWKS